MTQPDLISAELQKFIAVEFDKLKREVAEAFAKLHAQQVAKAANDKATEHRH